MNQDDVIDLLSLAASYDQRTVGEMDVKAWWLVAARERWTTPAAQRVIVDYYSHDAGRRRISPPAVSDGIRAARRQAAQAFVPPRIPLDLPDHDYPAWYRARLAEFVDEAVNGWAVGRPLPVEAVEPAGTAVPLDQAPAVLRAELERLMPRVGSGPRRSRPPTRATPLDLDPRRRAEARAQLDAVRPAAAHPDAGETTSSIADDQQEEATA